MSEVLRTLVDISRAAYWYRKISKEQYIDGGLDVYDEAARILTDRQGFGKFLAEQIGPNPGRTLEIAAGTGLVSHVLRDKIPDLQYIDLSAEALQKLKSRLGNGAVVFQADFLSLPYQQTSFDTLVCVGGYRYVNEENRGTFWREAGRVLRPNGRLFIAQFYPRMSRLVGSDIVKDLSIINHHFKLSNQRVFDTQIHGIPLRSGRYLSFEFHLNKT